MTRQLSPCGTWAAYKRHRRNGEEACAACKAAARDQQRQRVAKRTAEVAEVVKLAVVALPEVDPVDELERARKNLRFVEGLMEAGVRSGAAALSRQHMDLVAHIARLEASAGGKRVSVLDELARRRADRLAGAAD